jgi:hypothetical protein
VGVVGQPPHGKDIEPDTGGGDELTVRVPEGRALELGPPLVENGLGIQHLMGGLVVDLLGKKVVHRGRILEDID